MRLFVYGSLKRGFFNHYRFGFGYKAKFLGEAEAQGVSLVHYKGLPYPHAALHEGGSVKGELYELDDEFVLRSLDRMERGAGYKGVMVDVSVEGQDLSPALMYVVDTKGMNFDTSRGTVIEEWTLNNQREENY